MKPLRSVIAASALGFVVAGCAATPVAAPVTSTVTYSTTMPAVTVRTTATATEKTTATKTITTTATRTVAPPTTALATFEFLGSFKLVDKDELDSSCTPPSTSGYSDISEGTSVTVYDQAGVVDATGYLLAGKFDSSSGSCTYLFDVPEVPATASFYQVEISHRGKVTVSAEEAKGAAFAASLGS